MTDDPYRKYQQNITRNIETRPYAHMRSINDKCLDTIKSAKAAQSQKSFEVPIKLEKKISLLTGRRVPCEPVKKYVPSPEVVRIIVNF